MRVREREYRDTGTCLPDALLHSALRYLLGVNSDMLTPKMHLRGVIDLLEEIVLHELSRCPSKLSAKIRREDPASRSVTVPNSHPVPDHNALRASSTRIAEKKNGR
jgi:hypothetical protein